MFQMVRKLQDKKAVKAVEVPILYIKTVALVVLIVLGVVVAKFYLTQAW